MGKPHGIGIVGLGVISGAYLDTLAGVAGIRIVAVADLDAARASAVAASLPDAVAVTVEELVAHPEVDTVLNLTTPAAHAAIALAAIAHGKDVYGEKPLAATLAESLAVVRAADAAGVRIGCAPDTVLGTGVQTARAVIESGAIGRPVSASATWVSAGHERWHPNPDFYYLDGGGPLLDMGPYYITSLLHLLGPVRAVLGASSRTRSVRRIGSGPREGAELAVETDTHVTGVLEHVEGALSTVLFSFDAGGSQANPIEVHGESGSLAVPDPNTFGGDVRVVEVGASQWRVVAPNAGYVDAARGAGLIDFTLSPDAHTPPVGRASGTLALHAREIMDAVQRSARDGVRVPIQSTAQRPPLVPLTAPEQWRNR